MSIRKQYLRTHKLKQNATTTDVAWIAAGGMYETSNDSAVYGDNGFGSISSAGIVRRVVEQAPTHVVVFSFT